MQTHLWKLQIITAHVTGSTRPLALNVMCKCAGVVSTSEVSVNGIVCAGVA